MAGVMGRRVRSILVLSALALGIGICHIVRSPQPAADAAVQGDTASLGVPPPSRMGVGYAFGIINDRQIRRLAEGFSQVGKMVLWLPSPGTPWSHSAHVIITGPLPGGSTAPAPLPRHQTTFMVLDASPSSTGGQSWALMQIATPNGENEQYVRNFMTGMYRGVEEIEIRGGHAYFADQWDPLPSAPLARGREAKALYPKRFVLHWIADGTEIKLYYGDETTSKEDGRHALLELAGMLRPVNPSETLGLELLRLIGSTHDSR